MPATSARRRLIARIYLYSLFSTAVAIAVVALVSAGARRQFDRNRAEMPRYFVDRLAETRSDPVTLAREAERIGRAWRANVRLFDTNDKLLVEAGPPADPGRPTVNAAQIGPARDISLGRGAGAHGIYEGDNLVAYAVFTMPRSPSLVRPGFAVGGALALVALLIVSFLFARSLSRPLHRLARAAEALGAGDLSARAGITTSDEFGRLGQAFDDMAERLGEQVRAQRELIANVSHELRTPVSRVRVVLDIIAEGGDGAATRARIADMAHDLAELERLLDDVLTAARLDAPAASALPMHTMEGVTVPTLLDACADRFHARYAASHELVVVPPADVSTIFADFGLLRRALGNLLDNACKYSPPGSRITLRATTLTPDRVAIEVVDHGMGISAEDLTQLFRPFFRGDPSRTRSTGGVGLGLVIAKRVVEAHHGSLNISSTRDAGTTVRVELPTLDVSEALTT